MPSPHILRTWVPFVSFCLLSASALAGRGFEGKVVEVLSGEVIVVEDDRGLRHVVQFLAVASPHQEQEYFQDARRELTSKTLGKKVSVDWYKVSDGCQKGSSAPCEKIARVLQGREDLGLWQIAHGYAWHDRRSIADQSTPDRAVYSEAEREARNRKQGLWRNPNSVPPWLFTPPPKGKKKPSRHRPGLVPPSIK